MKKNNPDRFTILPSFIEKYKQNKIEVKAKKIANELDIKPTKNQLDGISRY